MPRWCTWLQDSSASLSNWLSLPRLVLRALLRILRPAKDLSPIRPIQECRDHTRGEVRYVFWTPRVNVWVRHRRRPRGQPTATESQCLSMATVKGLQEISAEDAERLLRDSPPASPSGSDTVTPEESNEESTGNDETSSGDSEDGDDPTPPSAPTLADFIEASQDNTGSGSNTPSPGAGSDGEKPKYSLGTIKKKVPEEPRPATAPPAAGNPGDTGVDGQRPLENGAAKDGGQAPPELPQATSFLQNGQIKHFYPIDGLPPPAPKAEMAQGQACPNFFQAALSQPVPSNSNSNYWNVELVKACDRFGLVADDRTSKQVVRHELDLATLALRTKRLPILDIRVAPSYQVQMPPAESSHKVTITYMTDLVPPATPVIGHESLGPMGLIGVKELLVGVDKIVQRAKDYFRQHLLETQHSLGHQQINNQDLYVSITALAWDPHITRKFPFGIPFPCLDERMVLANSPLEMGYYTLTLRCQVNSHKQYSPLKFDRPVSASATQTVASVVAAKPENRPGAQVPAVVRAPPRKTPAPPPAKQPFRPVGMPPPEKVDGRSSPGRRRNRSKREKRSKERSSSRSKKRSRSNSRTSSPANKAKPPRADSQGSQAEAKKESADAPASSPAQKDNKQEVFPKLPAPTPQHPLSRRKDPLLTTPKW